MEQAQRSRHYSEIIPCLSLYDARFNVFPPVEKNLSDEYVAKRFQPIKNTDRFYSTGSTDLDNFLGGGIRRGERIFIELGQHIGGEWHLPLMTSISSNFVLSGGCNVVIPTSGLNPEIVKELRSRHQPKHTVESSVRIGHFGEANTDDSCFFSLDQSSMTKTFETFYKVVETIRANPGDVSGTSPLSP